MRRKSMGNSKGKRPALSAAQKRNIRRMDGARIDWIAVRTPGWLGRDWKTEGPAECWRFVRLDWEACK